MVNSASNVQPPSLANYLLQHAKSSRSLCTTCRQLILPLISSKFISGPTFKLAPYGTFHSLQARLKSEWCPVCSLLHELILRQLDWGYANTASEGLDIPHIMLRPSIDEGGYIFDVHFAQSELGAMRWITKRHSRICSTAAQAKTTRKMVGCCSTSSVLDCNVATTLMAKPVLFP
jgi:hypothetical protein